MSTPNLSISTEDAPGPSHAAAPIEQRPDHILHERWPTLARAMSQYDRKIADDFSALAYESVENGIIRLDERQRLARAAEEVGLRPFDAQLLIACSLRQWVLDHSYDPTPTKDAPALSFEYQSWKRLGVRLALVAAFTVALEALILWKWLS